jgi:hypothetical protein
MCAILLLLIVVNEEVLYLAALKWHNIHTKLCENRSKGSEADMGTCRQKNAQLASELISLFPSLRNINKLKAN